MYLDRLVVGTRFAMVFLQRCFHLSRKRPISIATTLDLLLRLDLFPRIGSFTLSSGTSWYGKLVIRRPYSRWDGVRTSGSEESEEM